MSLSNLRTLRRSFRSLRQRNLSNARLAFREAVRNALVNGWSLEEAACDALFLFD